VKYRIHYPVGCEQVIDAESYVCEDGWHSFKTYHVNRFEPYWKFFSDDVKVESIDVCADHTG